MNKLPKEIRALKHGIWVNGIKDKVYPTGIVYDNKRFMFAWIDEETKLWVGVLVNSDEWSYRKPKYHELTCDTEFQKFAYPLLKQHSMAEIIKNFNSKVGN